MGALERIGEMAGPAMFALLFGAAVLEYLVPPIPGDTVTLFGGYLAVSGKTPLWLVFTAVTAGSVVGAAADYGIGVWLGRRTDRRLASREVPWLGITKERVEKVQAAYRKYGAALILANRFLPGIRAFFFIAAGMSGMRLGPVLLYGALSAALWNTGVLAVGYQLGANREAIEAFFRSYASSAWIALAAALGLWLAWRALRAWKTRRERRG